MDDQAPYKVTISPTGGELTIRTGVAPTINEPVKFSIKETSIDGPLEWCAKVYNNLPVETNILRATTPCTVCIVNVAQNSIEFHEDAEDKQAPVIVGRIILNPDIEVLGINTGAAISPHKLSDIVKMNRTLFPDKTEAMVLVSKLRDFKARVEKESDAFKDDRANFSLRVAQVAKTNLPEVFVVNLSPFIGEPKQPFTVEVVITHDLNVSLISPDLHDYVKEYAEKRIKEQVTKIAEITACPVLYRQA